jgi:hypothetical protein
MKPKMHMIGKRERGNETRREFPVTDFNYSAIDMSDCNARCADLSASSFRTSREYFDREANRDFLTEAAVFGIMMLTVAAPLLNGIHAIVDLIRGTGAI